MPSPRIGTRMVCEVTPGRNVSPWFWPTKFLPSTAVPSIRVCQPTVTVLSLGADNVAVIDRYAVWPAAGSTIVAVVGMLINGALFS